MSKDFYKILGVSENASSEEIKKAYRNLAHKYHPDKAGGDEAKFKEINEAYQTLSDSKKKEQYDMMRKYGGAYNQGFGNAGGFYGNPFGFSGNFSGSDFGWEGLDDLLGQFFGGMGGFSYGFGGQRTKTAPRQVFQVSIQGPKGMSAIVEIRGAKNINDKAKKIIEEFGRNLFKELE